MITMAMAMAMVMMTLYGYYAINIAPSISGRPCQTSSAPSSASRLRLAALRQLMLPSASRQTAVLILPRLRHDPEKDVALRQLMLPSASRQTAVLKGKERDACVRDAGLGWRLH